MKIKDNIYEFIKMYPHVSRKSLCNTFDISERTLRRYVNRFNLPRKQREKQVETQPIYAFFCDGKQDSKYTYLEFESFDEMIAFVYAQRHTCTFYVNEHEGKLYAYIKSQTGWVRKSDVNEIEDKYSKLK